MARTTKVPKFNEQKTDVQKEDVPNLVSSSEILQNEEIHSDSPDLSDTSSIETVPVPPLSNPLSKIYENQRIPSHMFNNNSPVTVDSDPSIVTSTARNIPSMVDQNLIYYVISVVRSNPSVVLEQDEEKRQELLRNQYAAAAETFYIWYSIAEGIRANQPPRPEDIQRVIIAGEDYPHRNGAANVTVYGTIVDHVGNSISLTMTDTADPQEVWREALLGLWYYTEQTSVASSGIDLNANLVSSTRWTVLGGTAASGRKNQWSNSAATAPATALPVFVSDPRKISDLPPNTVFSFKLSRIDFKSTNKGEGIYNLYGLGGKSDGAPNLYFFEGGSGVKSFMDQLTGLGVTVAKESYADVTDSDFIVTMKKLLSKSDKAWYQPVSVAKK